LFELTQVSINRCVSTGMFQVKRPSKTTRLDNDSAQITIRHGPDNLPDFPLRSKVNAGMKMVVAHLAK